MGPNAKGYVRLSQRTDGLCSCGQPVQPGKGRCRACADYMNAANSRSYARNPDHKFMQFNRNATRNKKRVSSICMAMHGHQIQVECNDEEGWKHECLEDDDD